MVDYWTGGLVDRWAGGLADWGIGRLVDWWTAGGFVLLVARCWLYVPFCLIIWSLGGELFATLGPVFGWFLSLLLLLVVVVLLLLCV